MNNKGKAGSQLDLQVAVESPRSELSSLLLKDHLIGSSIKWFSPIKETNYKEFVDRSFWSGCLESSQDSFWEGMKKPDQFWINGGPNWDGLAVITEPDNTKVLVLIEAKGHKGEMNSDCGACGRSLLCIEKQLDNAKNLMDIGNSNPWTKKYYQNANRIAYDVILNNLGVNTEVVFVLFANDPYWNIYDPTSLTDWNTRLSEANEYLGVSEQLLRDHRIKHGCKRVAIKV